VTAVHVQDRCFCDCVDRALFDRVELRRGREEVRDHVGALLRRAQDAGEVRRDVTVDDLAVVVLGVARSAPPHGWQRYLGFALDGLRPV
jgi:transcriptional regulator SbtR-like protein